MVGRGQEAKVTAAHAQIASFKTALDAFEVDNGHFPNGNNGLMDPVQQPRERLELARPLISKPNIPADGLGATFILTPCPGKH